MEKVLAFLLSFILIAGPLSAASRQDLAELQRKAKEKEEEMRKYKQQESQIAHEMQTLNTKEKATEKLTSKVAGDIKVIQTKRVKTIQQKELVEENIPMWKNLVRGELTNYIIQKSLESSYCASSEKETVAIFSAALQNHMLFLNKLTIANNQTAKKIETYKEKGQELVQKKDKLETQKEAIHSDFEKKQADYQTTHHRYQQLQSELRDIKESAAQLERILRAAEVKRAAAAKRAGKKVAAPALHIKKNSLHWPVSGTIISKFGKEYQSELKTWIFRDGIKISARAGESVTSAAEGTVIFAGEFRSYGNVVILEHKGGFFTIYGFLQEIRAHNGQTLHKGQIVGTAGKDTQGAAMGSGANAVYFEIRVGTIAIDPEDWLELK